MICITICNVNNTACKHKQTQGENHDIPGEKRCRILNRLHVDFGVLCHPCISDDPKREF